jgi:hypothetical protein
MKEEWKFLFRRERERESFILGSLGREVNVLGELMKELCLMKMYDMFDNIRI